MSRKRSSITLSLFPFLAVLICTMGVLVALLLLVVKQADQTAEKSVAEELEAVHQQSESLKDQLAETRLRVEVLSDARSELHDKLVQKRELRAHLDNELATLRERAEELEDELKAFQQVSQSAEEADLEQLLDQAKQQLQVTLAEKETLETEQTEDGPTGKAAAVYSIVPIAARSGTNRRPIYIECTAEGVFLYPGNHPLGPGDFVRPLQAGNPLDSALLAYREHWRKAEGAGDAYPLMVIRPSGAHWYPVLRRAMQGWTDEFGYELIPEDWEVDFGSSSPDLDKRVDAAIELAQYRQQELIRMGRAVALNQLGDRQNSEARLPNGIGGTGNRATPAGHLAGNGPGGGAEDDFDPLAKLSANYHQQRGVPGITLASNQQAMQSGMASSGNGDNTSSMFSGGAGQRNLEAIPGVATATPLRPLPVGNTTQVQNDLNGTRAISNASTSNGTGPLTPSPVGSRTFGQTSSGSEGSSQSMSAAASGAMEGRDGNASTSQGQNGTGNAAQSYTMGSGTPMGGNAPMPSETNGQSTESPAPAVLHQEAIARQRGENWALPARRRNVSAYHRPVYLKVADNRIELLPSVWNRKAVPIEINQGLEQAVDPLIDSVWKLVDSWGSLGFEGYWKPVLHVEVNDGNRQMVQRLEALLDGSGLDIEKTGSQ